MPPEPSHRVRVPRTGPELDSRPLAAGVVDATAAPPPPSGGPGHASVIGLWVQTIPVSH